VNLHPLDVQWFNLDPAKHTLVEDGCDYDPKKDYIVGVLGSELVFYEYDAFNCYLE
jgi:hypothetical protein